MALANAVAVAVGSWGCRYRELRPISFGGIGGGTTAGGGTSSDVTGGGPGQHGGDGAPGVDGDEEQGFSRGRGRGRGRDGAGEYEMVRVNGEPSS